MHFPLKNMFCFKQPEWAAVLGLNPVQLAHYNMTLIMVDKTKNEHANLTKTKHTVSFIV